MKLDPGNFQACLGRIAAAGRISAPAALDLLQEVADRADKMRRTGEMDPFVYAAHELAGKLQESAKLDHLDTLRNALIRNRLLAEIDRNGGIRGAATTIRSLLHGTNVGSRDSIESQWKNVAGGWRAQLDWALRKAGLDKAARTGALDREIAQELWGMNTLGPERMGRLTPARQIAEAIHPLLATVRDRLNQAGARIAGAFDYAASTMHDPDKMRAAAGSRRAPPDQAFAAWWRKTEPRLAEKTFDDVEPGDGETMEQARRRFGRSVYDAVVTGIHMAPDQALGLDGEAPYVPAAFDGTRNLARSLSQQRVLYWKDGGAWADHMRDFGTGSSLTDRVMRSLDTGARQAALMEKLGTNPAANLNQIVRQVQERYRGDLDGVKAFGRGIAGIEAVLGHLDGSANIPANEMAARISASIRNWENMTSLGSVSLTHFASIWLSVPSEMVHHGVSRLQAMGALVHALRLGKTPDELREIDAQIGAFADGLARDMQSRFGAATSIPGRISALASSFMKWTGLHVLFDRVTAAARETFANHLARNVGNDFAALEPHLAQMLGKYGIGPEEWELLRNVPNLPTVGGRAFLTPADAYRIDPVRTRILLRNRGVIAEDATKDQAAAAGQQFAQRLADRLYGYYGDSAAHAVVSPGVRERALLLGQSKPGSIPGEMARFFAQFKIWPLAAMHQIIGREIHMSLTNREAMWNLGVLLAMGIPAGYLRMTANDVMLGHPPRNPLDWSRDRDRNGQPTGIPHGAATLLSALAQSGGAGILGDFLFGEVMRNRTGAGLLPTMGGPVASDADTLFHLYNEWTNGKAGWPDLAHFFVRHIPFANLVYLKGALDYLLWYHLYEAASPGWWERTNRRLLREQGRAMTGYAPGQGVPLTPWGIGASAGPAASPPPAPG